MNLKSHLQSAKGSCQIERAARKAHNVYVDTRTFNTAYEVKKRLPRCSQNGSPLKTVVVKHKYWAVFGSRSCFYFRLAEAALTAGVVRSPAGWSPLEHEQRQRAGASDGTDECLNTGNHIASKHQ